MFNCPLFDLTGKVVVITGAATGIGFACSRALAQAGAKVIGCGRRLSEGNVAFAKLQAEGLDVSFRQVDVTDTEGLHAFIKKVAEDYGKIDVLINNAGIIRLKPLEDYQEEDWNALLATDLKGAYEGCRAVLPIMKAQGHGKIINLSSITTHKNLNNGCSVYAIFKSGVDTMTKSMAVEWAKYGITVNAFAPTTVLTAINSEFYDKHPEVAEQIGHSIPLGRVSVPEDLAGTAVYLASKASDFMTGQIIRVDGGHSVV